MTSNAAVAGEELPIGSLSEYLRGKVEGVDRNLTARQFRDGHSNLTYLLLCGDSREYVLRRGPLGPVAPKAHDMSREYRVLQAVHPHFPEAPHPVYLCEDTSVLGAVFFLMERRHGRILRDDVPAEFAPVPNHQQRISEAFLDGMVRLHAIDVNDADLSSLGKPEGFLTRQVQGWIERWNRARTEEVREMEVVGEWLTKQLPVSPAPTLVHNDYKLDNLMFRSVDEIEAVLDWEMATIGDPLADFGLTLCYWAWLDAVSGSILTCRPGWLTRDELIARYSERTGRKLSRIVYYEVLGIYKLAVIVQQIYFRYHRRQTQDARFRDFNQRARTLAQTAHSLLEKHG